MEENIWISRKKDKSRELTQTSRKAYSKRKNGKHNIFEEQCVSSSDTSMLLPKSLKI